MVYKCVHAAAVIGAAALLLAACGGAATPASSPAGGSKPAVAASSTAASASGVAAGAASAAKPSAAATGSPYTIGSVLDLTGPYAPLGVPIKGALDLEVKKLNASGGIKGHPINLVVEDSASDPSKGMLGLKKILEQKPVVEIGPSYSSIAMAMLPDLVKSKLPAITIAADEEQVQPVRKYVFMVPAPTVVQVSVLDPYMKAHNITNIAIIHDTTAYGNSGPRDFKAAEAKSGVHVVEDETYNLTDKDMTPQLTKIKNNPQVQGVMLYGAGATPAIVTKDFHALNFKVPLFLTSALSTGSFVKATGTASENAIVLAPKAAVTEFLPPNDTSRRLFQSFDVEFKQATGQEADAFAARGYDAFHLAVNAIQQAGTDSDKIVAALERAKFDGMQGSYEFSPTNHAGLTPDSLIVTKIENGKFVPVK